MGYVFDYLIHLALKSMPNFSHYYMQLSCSIYSNNLNTIFQSYLICWVRNNDLNWRSHHLMLPDALCSRETQQGEASGGLHLHGLLICVRDWDEALTIAVTCVCVCVCVCVVRAQICVPSMEDISCRCRPPWATLEGPYSFDTTNKLNYG